MRLRSRATHSVSAAVLVATTGTIFALSCGPSEQPAGSPETPPVELGDLSGLYRVSGTTAQFDGSDERRVSGTVVLTQEGARYTTTYDLKTTFPGQYDDLRADVIGTGEGRVEGAVLTGTAETQLVVSTIPGVDPKFAFIPRVVGVRLTSTTFAEFAPDGSVTMRIENQPGEGETYTPTRTVLKGLRVSDSGASGAPIE